MTNTTSELATQPPPHDAQTLSRVVDSIVLRGDLSGLAPKDRARFYVQVCESLGLNPAARPFDFLRLQGKEIMYANKNCADQLAAIHRVNRKIVEGPKIVDISGTKVAFAVCEATHPNGRVETATATLPVTDPINLYMKLETKAKRRATLSILGLALLDEMELETIPANVQEPGGGVDLSLAHEPVADDDVESEEEAPASRAYATFLDKLSGAQRLVLVVDLYAALLAGLRDEDNSPEEFIGGDDGAAAQARKRILALGHRITKAEAMQVLLSRALAEILDDQTGIEPGPRALESAAEWWRVNGARAKTLEHAHRGVPWYALARRYSGATAAADVKRATTALESAVTMRPPPSGGGSPSHGGAANAQGAAQNVASQGDAAQARSAVEEFGAHLGEIPDRGSDRGAARIAGAFWKRRMGFVAEGTHAEAMGLVVDALHARGVEGPGSWLQEIGEKNGYVQRPRKVA